MQWDEVHADDELKVEDDEEEADDSSSDEDEELEEGASRSHPSSRFLRSGVSMRGK